MGKPKGPPYNWRDLAEAAIGASVIAFPVATTEEVWNLSAELPLGRVLLFALASIAILALVVFTIHQNDGFSFNRRAFILRVTGTYGVSLLIAALLLFGLDRLDLLHEPLIALKRTIIVAFPASFAGTAVDSFSSKS